MAECVLPVPGPQQYTIAVFYPNCSSDPIDRYGETVKMASDYASNLLVQYDIKLEVLEVPVCGLEMELKVLLDIMSDGLYNATVGTATPTACSTAANLAFLHHHLLVTWTCLSDEVAPDFTHMARSLPTARQTAEALAAVLKSYQWPRVAIVYEGSAPFMLLAVEIKNILVQQDFLTDDNTLIPVTHAANYTPIVAALEKVHPAAQGKTPFFVPHLIFMMTPWYGHVFLIVGPLWQFTCHSTAECVVFCCWGEQAFV